MIGFQRSERAHAKLNLTLDVGAPRADGYHDIDSIVVKISPYDEVTVSIRSGAGAVRSIVKDKRPDALATTPLPKGPANLVHRAAELARLAWMPDSLADVWVTLVKRIPVESGLGAGSSDAASVLRLMAVATGRSIEDAMHLGAELGSDVNLFLIDGPVRMTGRGERIEPVPQAPRLHGVIARPLAGVSTAAAYARLDSVERRYGRNTLKWIASGTQAAFPFGNDFQEPITELCQDVATTIERLRAAGADPVLLCGSGSAVYGGSRDSMDAVRIVTALAKDFPWIKKVETLH